MCTGLAESTNLVTVTVTFFSWLGMLIRCCVAALDFNFNVNRGTKVSADGHQMYKMKACFFLARVCKNMSVIFRLTEPGKKWLLCIKR